MASVGRPTKYSPEILEKAQDYLENFTTAVPTLEDLSLELRISRDTVYDWSSQEDKKEFSYIVNDILAKQSSVLIDKGLRGKFNPTICKLLLHKHNYNDKIEVEQENIHRFPDLTDDELDESIKQKTKEAGIAGVV